LALDDAIDSGPLYWPATEADVTNTTDQNGGDTRLEGWKAIAAYFGTAPITVQRWERDLGLPVHRLHIKRRARPFALVSELEEWRKGRDEAPEVVGVEPPASNGEPEPRPLDQAWSARSRAMFVAIAGILAIAATLGIGFRSSGLFVTRASPSVGGSKAVTIVSDNGGLVFGAVAVDESAAYVVVVPPDSDDEYVAVVALGSGPARKLYDAAQPGPNYVTSVAVIGEHLYWGDGASGPLTDSEIWRAPKNGNGLARLVYRGAVSGQELVDVWSLTSDDTRLYAADAFQGRVLAMDTNGRDVVQIGPMRYGGGFELARENTLAVLGGTLFVAQSAVKTSGLPTDAPMQPRIQCHPVDEIASPWVDCLESVPLNATDPIAIAAGDGTVFVGQKDTIYSIPSSGGAVSQFRDPILHKIAGLAYRDQALYVTDNMGPDGLRPEPRWARLLRVDLR
jgi:hypothetical protein